jgi:membrane protease YdiL (CAAX protease family)
MPWDVALIFFVLAVILPWRGRVKMKKLLSQPQMGTMERLTLYGSTIAFQWFMAAVVAWRAWTHGYTAGQLGLAMPGRGRLLIVSIVGAMTIGIFQWLNLRRAGKIPIEKRGPLVAIAQRIFPQTTVELLPYLALAITAGICEEFLYRGFTMAVLARVGFPAWAVVSVSSVMFGLAHVYQGRGGLVGTLLVGTVLGMARIAYDSLVPVIFWHSALDMVAGVAGPKYLTASSAGVAEKGESSFLP